jgi:diguanylate cyclase (GGDEF)-like protein
MSHADWRQRVLQFSQRLRGEDASGGKYLAGRLHGESLSSNFREVALPAVLILGCAALLRTTLLHPSWPMLVRLSFYALAATAPVAHLIYGSSLRNHGKPENDKSRAQHMAELHLRTIEALALAIDAKEHIAHFHLERVRVYAEAIGREVGLSEEKIEALLHDFGKQAAPEPIIGKSERSMHDEPIPIGALTVNNANHQGATESGAIDHLTGLPNARSLLLELESEVSRCQSDHTRFGIIRCGLDGVKHVNDRFGHVAGDQVLQTFARQLKIACREYDFVARIGGAEFVILAPGLKASELPIVQDRICAAAAVSAEEVCGSIAISASVGMAFYSEDGRHAAQLLMKADQRMSQMKKTHQLPRIVQESPLRWRSDAGALPWPHAAAGGEQDDHRHPELQLEKREGKRPRSIA